MPINIDNVFTQAHLNPGLGWTETVFEMTKPPRILYITTVEEPWGDERVQQHLRDHPETVAAIEKRLDHE